MQGHARDGPPIHREANMHTKQVRLEIQYSTRHMAVNPPHGALPLLPHRPCQLLQGSRSTLALTSPLDLTQTQRMLLPGVTTGKVASGKLCSVSSITLFPEPDTV